MGPGEQKKRGTEKILNYFDSQETGTSCSKEESENEQCSSESSEEPVGQLPSLPPPKSGLSKEETVRTRASTHFKFQVLRCKKEMKDQTYQLTLNFSLPPRENLIIEFSGVLYSGHAHAP